jgi:RNA polymerase-interacting CarD/CdnL/TRCF family regulator
MTTTNPFEPGTPVIYGLHGKCLILSVETREAAGQTQSFYKLEVQKSNLSRSTRQEPAIWVPLPSARAKGLRRPIQNGDEAEAVYAVIQSREYYFPLDEAWSASQPKLEAAIRDEGAIGLAKVISFLHVLKRKQIVASPEVARLHETVSKLLLRELAEATGEPTRTIEDKVARGLRHKLLPSN